MDPLTTFSLACGVIQVVDFSMKVLAKCKEIHDHGALSEHREIEEITKHLTDLRIDTTLPQSSGSTQTPDDRELRELAKTCSTTAEQLVAKLQTLKVEGPHKKRQAFGKTVKALREKGKIHDIEKRLNSYRSVLDTKILVNLRQRSDFASIQQRHDFQTLDQGIQKLITNLSEGPKSFEELRTVTRKENEETREHISEAFRQQQEQHEKTEYRKRFLDSLWFDEIYSREENIVDAHRETFEWIFDVSDHAVGPWGNFIRWLESGQGTYWINGKAGSGKSTLMSFLCQDDRTMKSLTTWSANSNKDVLIPKFYFWSAGKQMEKSIEGLLRSLIWQVLQFLPDLEITSSISHSRDMLAAWTERRLQNTLQSLLQQASSSHLFCFFIDGLDEYEGDQADLIRFIQDLVQSDMIKVCLSSRPYRVFDQAFGYSARLRLQDLTRSDIEKFVVDRFQGILQVQSLVTQIPSWLDNVTGNLLNRANGVFLWVSLAVKDQIRGLENGDSPEQLQERLVSLPDEVEGIYARMLSQIEKVYRKEASIFLQMASQTPCESVLDFVLASDDRLEDMLSSSDPLPERGFIDKSHTARQRIATTCAGLLEVNEWYDESQELYNSVSENEALEWENASSISDEASLKSTSLLENISSTSDEASLKSEKPSPEPDRVLRHASSFSGPKIIRYPGEATDDEMSYLDGKFTVDFIHRTARDFMLYSAQGGSFLEANTPAGFHPEVSYVKVSLAKARLFECTPYDVDSIMSGIRLAEDKTGVAQVRLCHLMDDVMSRIDRTCGPRPTNTHWSIRWHCWHWKSMHQELLIPDSKSRSRSSSNDSFHSVDSQPNTLVKNPDFLAFAVYHKLHRYVIQVIHDRKEPLDADTVSCLMYYAIYSFEAAKPWKIDDTPDDLKLINEFLRRGGNPNLKDSRLTTWSSFLKIMHDRTYKNVNDNELRRAYMQTSVTFVEKGADLHSIVTVQGRDNYSGVESYWFDLDLSALAIIELCLNNQLEHSHLRGLCTSKDAPYYSRCTKISKITNYTRRAKQSLKVSDHESTAILEIYKKHFIPGSSREDWEAEMQTYLDKLVEDRLEDVSESEFSEF